MARIVLAHGIGGMGARFPFANGPYFNGIRARWQALGHDVLEPSVAPFGSLEARSAQLATAILKRWPDDGVPLYLVGHSMGGLDCRRVISDTRYKDVGRRVRRLATIATPHLGTPVADAALTPTHPLRPYLPTWLLSGLSSSLGCAGDLVTRKTLQDADWPGVDYLRIGCDGTALGWRSPLFTLTRAVGGIAAEGNDGLVTLASAQGGTSNALQAVWPVDHGGAIGWPTGNFTLDLWTALILPPPDHLARYDALLSKLLAD